ncbi:MAG: hypothetical protein J6J24_03545 [Clostridia bacterium]|nr:hypothetical protein [Clostridia bacterium]
MDDKEIKLTENEDQTIVEETSQAEPVVEVETENQGDELVAESEMIEENLQEDSVEEETSQAIQKEKKEKPVKQKKEKVKKEKVKKVKVEEPEVDEFEGLSDDEIYTKIQTAKLLKRKKTKRIATLVALCFSFALAVCVIVLSVVPVSLKPKCLYEGFSSVTMHSGYGSEWGFSRNNKEKTYEEFMKVYDESFAQPYISAIFSGSLFSYKITEEWSKTKDSVISSELTDNNAWYIKLAYDQDQTFTYQNGRVYESVISNSTFDGILKFKEAYIVVNEEAGFKSTSVLIVANNYPKKDGTLESHIVKVTIKADTNKIYDSWKDLKKTFDKE